jgi:hypothetical protein
MPRRPDAFASVPKHVTLSLNLPPDQCVVVFVTFVATCVVQQLSQRIFKRKCPKFWASLDANERRDLGVRCATGAWGLLSSLWALGLLVVEARRGPMGVGERMFAPAGSFAAGGEALFSAAVGYFAWDVWYSVALYHLYGPAFLLHAVASFVAFGVPKLMPRGFLFYYGSVFLVWEMTAPFLGARTLLIKAKRTDGLAFKCVETIGFVLFIIIRFVFGVPAMVRYVADAREMYARGLAQPTSVYATFTLAAILFPLMNCMWVSKMLKILFKSKKKSA